MLASDARVIYLMRMQADPEKGLALEDVTRKIIEHEGARYLSFLLADQYLHGELTAVNIEMVDCEEQVIVTAFFDKSQTDDIADFLEDLDGYLYSPLTGGTDSFGYNSPTVAWLVAHASHPIIFWRANDEVAKEAVLKYIEHYAQMLRDGSVDIVRVTMPEPNSFNQTTLVPVCYEKQRRVRTIVGRRTARRFRHGY